MRGAPIKEIKARFDQLEKERLESWLEEHPKPLLTVESLQLDMAAGNVSFMPDGLADFVLTIADDRVYSGTSAEELINCPSLETWRASVQSWNASRTSFETSLKKARRQYQDRCLFDYENVYTVLQDFSRWSPQS